MSSAFLAPGEWHILRTRPHGSAAIRPRVARVVGVVGLSWHTMSCYIAEGRPCSLLFLANAGQIYTEYSNDLGIHYAGIDTSIDSARDVG
ncbi:MAG TPA: hypothetical protein VFK47_08815, partial [Ktedonobacteraceae bacterium]|nr:hypothetical protein [Ktedonobacteraceae bacterium]